jgi:hypothetical protein
MKPFLQPRIWRHPDLDFTGDEPLQAADVYTDNALARIKSHGFDAVWLRGKLYNLMDSTILPTLNSDQRADRIASINTVIERAAKIGMGVYLFFNEPLAPLEDDPIWDEHPELKGQSFYHPVIADRSAVSLCTSIPLVMRFFDEAVNTTFDAIPGMAGVLLITASEYHTHCWAHQPRRHFEDGSEHSEKTAAQCPRCAEREPSEVVGELVTVWRDAVAKRDPKPRVICWNWSWSFWYPEPQAEVINALPDGVELMADFERGGKRAWHDRTIDVDEYSLGFVGPSDRFLGSKQCAVKRNMPIHVKLQLGTTHEIGNTPNTPLIASLHEKVIKMHTQGAAGTMATWNFGCLLTLNTFAFGMLADNPQRYADRDRFFADLATRYFGPVSVEPLTAAWVGFGEAFQHFPFSIPMVYYGPMNRAPVWPLSLEYRDEEPSPSWMMWDSIGDRLEPCFGPFTLDEIIDGFDHLQYEWRRYLPEYLLALAPSPDADEQQNIHRREERNTATMIGHQLQSNVTAYRWHRWRGRGRRELDDTARRLVEEELANVQAALPLVESDPRLGYHYEAQGYLYNADMIHQRIGDLEKLIARG